MPDQELLIIAEVGSVHDGSFGNAKKLIELASHCGADVVKFQTHIASSETLPDAPAPSYFRGEPRYSYFERTGFSEEQWMGLRRHALESNIGFLSSPFSIDAVELLERIGIERYKIPSGEVTNLPMLQRIAETGKHIYLSSGMSDWTELDSAVNTILKVHDKITVMQCASEYPCTEENVGLNVIGEMKERYGLQIGYSDHTRDNYAAYAAAALGAEVIEKHLTFSRFMYGSDAANSAEPKQFAGLVRGLKSIERMRSVSVDKSDNTKYADMKRIFEKSIVAAENINQGSIIEREAIAFKKPGTGIPPSKIDNVIGRRATVDIDAGNIIREEWVSEDAT